MLWICLSVLEQRWGRGLARGLWLLRDISSSPNSAVTPQQLGLHGPVRPQSGPTARGCPGLSRAVLGLRNARATSRGLLHFQQWVKLFLYIFCKMFCAYK